MKEKETYYMHLFNFLFGSVMIGIAIIFIFSFLGVVFSGLFIGLIMSAMYFHYLMTFNRYRENGKTNTTN